ncbi:MAG TPA: hypothetical protein VIM73_19940, partial [Polyangiaceae bacterium]
MRARDDGGWGRVDVGPTELIGVTNFLPSLLESGACLHGRCMLAEIRRARLTEAALRIPADSRANPGSAERTLTKFRATLFDGFVKRRVPRGAAKGVLHMLGASPCSANAPPEDS